MPKDWILEYCLFYPMCKTFQYSDWEVGKNPAKKPEKEQLMKQVEVWVLWRVFLETKWGKSFKKKGLINCVKCCWPIKKDQACEWTTEWTTEARRSWLTFIGVVLMKWQGPNPAWSEFKKWRRRISDSEHKGSFKEFCGDERREMRQYLQGRWRRRKIL